MQKQVLCRKKNQHTKPCEPLDLFAAHVLKEVNEKTVHRNYPRKETELLLHHVNPFTNCCNQLELQYGPTQGTKHIQY